MHEMRLQVHVLHQGQQHSAAHESVCLSVCLTVCMCLCVCVCTCMQTHSYTYIYTYLHVGRQHPAAHAEDQDAFGWQGAQDENSGGHVA